jgi:predicted hydrocarbon binding protein
MTTRNGAPREVALPVAVFDALRDAIETEMGTLEAVSALHQAGYAAGRYAALTLNRDSGGDALQLSSSGFWTQLSAYFDKRGWGSLAHRSAHPAIGILSSPEWAEASPSENGAESGCAVSAGFLSGLLSQLAGGAVGVLEVRCRGRGDDACEFAFGSETAIHDLYGRMLEGDDLDRALEAL